MIIAGAVLVGALLIAIAIVGARMPADLLEGRESVVHTKDDRSIRGVVSETGDALIVMAPQYLGEAAMPLEGDAVVPKVNVSWVQRLTSEV